MPLPTPNRRARTQPTTCPSGGERSYPMVTVTATPDVLMGDWTLRVDGIIVFSDPDLWKVLRITRQHFPEF